MKYKSKLKLTALVTAIAILSNNITVSIPVSRYVFNEINVSAADEPGTDSSNTSVMPQETTAAVPGETAAPSDNEQADTPDDNAAPDNSNDNNNGTDNSNDNASDEVPDDTTEPDISDDEPADPDNSDSTDTNNDSTDEEKPAENNDIIINTAEELVKYSQDYYADPSKYQKINVTIAATMGNFSNLDGFVSIGTPEYPFDAKLIITSSTDFSIALDEPFFAYIYDSASIVNSSNEITSVTISRTAKVDSALFAENVLHNANGLNDNAAEWKVNIGSYVDSGISVITPFSSVIGTLKEGADVALEVNNSTELTAYVEGSGDVGLACGKMEAGSNLTVTVSGDSSYNITSTGASAGGMVGSMESSTFTLESEFNGTGTITAAGYAGGLVGYAKNSEVSFDGTAKVSGTIIGEIATGGIFGYYKNEKADETFDISHYNVDCTLNGANSGGIFGQLENSGNMTINKGESETAEIKSTRASADKKNYGGFIGIYSSDYTSNTLTVSGVTATVNNSADSADFFGGAIGKVDDNSYIKFENVTVSASNCRNAGTTFGGLVGYVNRAFIDANNITVKISGYYGYGDFNGGGVIGNINDGVLRLSGTTDLTATNACSGGQIVGTRGNKALIYALSGWKLKRGNPSAFDDIGTWGEVLRFGSSPLFDEINVLNVDMDKHTVTVKSAKATVGSLAEFAVLALNMQMNDGVSSDSTLIFDSTSTSSSLLWTDITLNCDVDLTGTGITGLTRDDGKNNAYAGIFDGSGHTITLAIGEPYGYRGDTPIGADDTSEGNGYIYRHIYDGLFAKTQNATFKNLTVGGVINIKYTDGNNNYFIGGLSGFANGDFTAENITVQESINISGSAANYCLIGGIVGQIIQINDSTAVNISITDSTVNSKIKCDSEAKYISGAAFGEIGKSNKFSVTAKNVTMGFELTNTSKSDVKKIGGFIANISNVNTPSSGRTITITNMTVDGAKVTSKFGGALLGEAWNNTDVTIGSETGIGDGITIKNSEVIQINDGNDKNFAGIVTNATGYWKVYDVNIDSIKVDCSAASSFGMLVNKGVYKYDDLTFGLYMEFEKENAYKINGSDITVSANTIYDDIIATCSGSIGDKDDDKDLILQNDKCAVISIHTSGGKVIMDGDSCNTYQNQTSVKKVDPYSRYYYNLDVIRNKALAERSPAEKLMLWSVNKYAYSNVKNYFNDSYANANTTVIPAGNYDMTGYSYYPIDMPANVTIVSGAAFTFCNDKIESGENGTGNSDSMARKTIGDRSQHYLMHCGLFRNAGGSISAGSVTFSGCTGADPYYSGAYFCGTVMGSVTRTASINLDGVVLNGIKINGTNTNADYTPLLINKIDSYSTLKLSNVSTTEQYKTDNIDVAATSLIGDVGNSDGNSRDIKLTFSGLTLDGRTADISDSTANAALYGAYNTTKSIFSKAILLNSFKYKSGSNCTGTYNFRLEDDWDGTTPKHNVAYGMEISNSVEYVGLQEHYLKSETFTDPTRSDADSKYDFSGSFLPYVAVAYNKDANYHEIKVNQSSTADLDKGCGTYNDPYIISSGKQLELVDKILNGGLGDADEGTIINYTENNYSAWCSSKNSHKVLIWTGSSFKYEDDTKAPTTLADIQSALSTAYYMLNGDVTITSADFVGIGKSIPFKGAILGNGTGENIKTITNKTVKPLIYQSTGAVIKDIALNVSADFSGALTSNANTNYETDGGNTEFYGGVIGIVNGGDTIIDNVSVNFLDFDKNNKKINTASTINIKTGTNYGNKAVGGYIGVVRYGGVIFRNMGSANHAGITADMNSLFKSTDDFKDSANKVLLYCNPIIGRVIDGYAVTESDSYKSAEADVTMKNGTKNYSIADIKAGDGKISFADGTITVADAQQLHLLGCIAMSGAGSAGTDGNYPNNSNKAKFSYGINQMVRHAAYSDVGTDKLADNTPDYTIAKTDSYSRNSVPYIIYQYTTAENGTYAAKNLTYNKSVFSIELTKGTYKLPDGFRGIGCLNSTDGDISMHIKDLNGNGSIIELNMNFYKYDKSYDIYYNLNAETNLNTGLGLFNNLVQSDGGCISDITLSGNVRSDYYLNHDGGKNDDSYKKCYFSCAGGLAGVSSGNLNVDNVNISNLAVSAQYVTGGLVGFATGKAAVKNSKIEDLTVADGSFVGGTVGYARNCNITEDTITVNAAAIRSSSKHAIGNYNNHCGVGGLIGTVADNGSNKISASFEDIEINGIKLDAVGNAMFVGGLVGCVGTQTGDYKVALTTEKVTIKDLHMNTSEGYDVNNNNNLYSVYAGGMFGVLKQSVEIANITDVHIGDAENPSEIHGRASAAGITGLMLGPAAVDNFTITNCVIRAENLVEAVGGMIGKLESVNKNVMQIKITNSKVSDCDLRRGNNNGKGQIGGLIGYSCNNNGSKIVNIYGYNIALDNVQITNAGNNPDSVAGDICGVLHSKNTLRLIGVSYKKADDEKHVSKDIGTNSGASCIIYADYKGSSFDDATANKAASSVNSTDNVDMDVFPYVTVNPKKDIDSSKFLTGDGADKSAIDAIIADIGKTNGYRNASDTYKDTFATKYESKLMSFNGKTGLAIQNDFPILLVNDSSYRNVTEMLNSYIHILTNDTTVINYAADNSGICNVVITPMRLNDSGVFETNTDFTETLKCENGYFRMTNDYDSNYKQFTLIDIQYLDPTDAAKIAYHLYIPVYVEKMLNFDFSAAALSGTTYNTSFYTDGDPVLENYGTPVTSHITYSYKRTVEEWQGVINSGEDMLTSYGKSVLLDSKIDLPTGTRLVLVDRNNYSKAYYSTIGNAFTSSDHKLDFSKFSTADGTGFEPVTFCDLLNKAVDITAAADANGMLVKCTGDISKAVFKVGDDYYRKKTDSDTDTSKLYSVTLTAKKGMTDDNDILRIEEDYYISFFTDADNTQPMRNITIRCDSRLGDTNMTPSHLDNSNAANSMVHMILGNLYDQNFTFKTNGSEVINDNNRSISAELKTVISLKSENAADIKAYLNYGSIHLYHAFLIEATRTDESGTEKGIKGNPSVSGTYKLGTDTYPMNFSNTDSIVTIPSGSSMDIKDKLLKDGSVTISCSDLEITYSDGESIIAQFPERKNQDEQYGVTLSANSNLAYVPDNIGQSKMTENRNDSNGKSYYRENIEAATLSYNLPTNLPNEMVKLGVNGLETNDKITAVGYYNVLNLTEAVVDKAKKVQFTLSLYQKADDGSYTAVAIGDYLENITLYDKNNSAKAPEKTGESYDFIFDKDTELKYEAGSFEIFSSYSVITGGDFESGGKLYSNYKVQLTAQLLDENNEPIENSGCSDYIIYTNAKINSQMMSAG